MKENSALLLLRRKWMTILLSGVLMAGLFMGYKYVMRDTYTLAYDVDAYFGTVIRVEAQESNYDTLKYEKYFYTDAFLYSFLDATKSRYEYGKFAKDWERKTRVQKKNWLASHLRVKNYGAGRLEVGFYFKSTEPMDAGYLEKNGVRYARDYLSFVHAKDSFGKYTVTGETSTIPKQTVISQDRVNVKYGVIGFMLGLVSAVTVLLTWNLRKAYHGDD